MSAGDVLIAASENDTHERHFLVYPALFNYRHGVELAMKWIIAQYGKYSSAAIRDTDHHDLWRLWKSCRQVMVEVGSEDDAIRVVEQVIKDFHDLDKSALAFRYARDNNGAPIALPGMSIDIENVRDVMQAVDHFFEGADGQLDAHSSDPEYQ